ncbi:MAG TPA: efflux RND transporter periplasmic adaptor subunit [Acidobacteriota bacterium]|nr:efflux RND transporter periplasmic adaptor subunit [Acidobacteriota bacterium]
MKFRNKVFLAAGFVAVLATATTMILRETATLPATEVPAGAREIPVRTVSAERRTIPQTLTQPGNLEAWETAFVTGQTGSRIARIHVNEGDAIEAGQIVAEMEDSSLRQAEIQVNSVRTDLKRMETLVGLGAVSRQQFDQVKAQYDTAESNYRLIRENTYLRSPINGIVTERHFVAGEAFMTGMDRPSIVTVMNLNPLKVAINVSERYYPQVRQGMPVQVRLDTYPNRVFRGRVEYISPAVNPDTRTFRVEIRIGNDERMLSPGMFARVSLTLKEITGIFIPAEVVQRDALAGEDYVFVVENGLARRSPVVLGDRVEALQRINAGLETGAPVISEGIGRIKDGSPVRVME